MKKLLVWLVIVGICLFAIRAGVHNYQMRAELSRLNKEYESEIIAFDTLANDYLVNQWSAVAQDYLTEAEQKELGDKDILHYAQSYRDTYNPVFRTIWFRDDVQGKVSHQDLHQQLLTDPRMQRLEAIGNIHYRYVWSAEFREVWHRPSKLVELEIQALKSDIIELRRGKRELTWAIEGS